MHLSDHSLRQLDEAYLASLDAEALRGLSVRLLADLKEARERLNQTPNNSSRPPSSRAPWERAADDGGDDPDTEVVVPGGEDSAEAQPRSGEAPGHESAARAPAPGQATLRRAGKQPGAPGKGRTQVFQAHESCVHYPEQCAGCGRVPGDEGAVAYTGFQALDIVPSASPGLTVTVIDHRYYELRCGCGHHTRAVAGRGGVDPLLKDIALTEWRVVGPGLAALIVALSLRFRLSRARIRELLMDWLGIELSTGTIHQTLHEAAAALAPAEDELVRAVLESERLHADETPWPQHERTLWLWVFTAAQVTLYYIAGRGKELVDNVLDGFHGWLMSDGWMAYRHYPKRLRCWAHLMRKARGLSHSLDRDARAFGRTVDGTLETLRKAVYAAREGPPREDLMSVHAERLDTLRQACERHRNHVHAKTRALAVELLNDWEAIFQVVRTPEHPLTNNDAERALRHWVISRKLSHGTRTDTGSRVFALLASVIDTCRQRGHSPWPYLTTAIADRRAGRPLAPLPQPGE